MGGIKYSVHPLFFAVGFYYALTGRIFIFLVYSITALVHETGHAIAAEKAGYKLNKITLKLQKVPRLFAHVRLFLYLCSAIKIKKLCLLKSIVLLRWGLMR